MSTSTELTHSNTEGKHLGLALLVISAAQLMIILDATIVNVALPTIHRDLHFSVDNLEWLITAYALTFGGLLLFGGRTGDLFGKRRMFMVGIAVFSVSSLLGGFATSDVWLIVTRAFQGVGGAIVAPTALSLITTNFAEGPHRNRAMGVYAAMSGAGGAAGLLLGGLLVEYVSWRWIFFVNVPIGVALLVLAPRALNESATISRRLDVPGALSATAGMLALVYGLSNVASHSWTAPSTVVSLVAAAVLLAGFVAIEARRRDPLMPLRIFANRNRSAVYALMLCVATAMFAMFFFLTQYLQNVQGWSALRAGVGFLPMTVGIIVAALVTSRVIPRVGIRVPLMVGPAAVGIGLIDLSRLTVTSGYLSLLWPLMGVALGMGFTFVPLTLAAVSGVSNDEAGLASALLNTTQQVGGALGLAILSTVAIDAARAKLTSLAAAAGGHATAASAAVATTHGYTTAFRVGSVVAIAGFAIAAALVRTPRAASDAPDEGDLVALGAEA